MERQIENLNAYEIIEKRKISDLNSDGYILKHKKTGAYITLLLMMTKTRCFISDSVRPRRTARGLPIFWNIPFCAAPGTFR